MEVTPLLQPPSSNSGGQIYKENAGIVSNFNNNIKLFKYIKC